MGANECRQFYAMPNTARKQIQTVAEAERIAQYDIQSTNPDIAGKHC